jgi:outer membrane protein assembly factor BamB
LLNFFFFIDLISSESFKHYLFDRIHLLTYICFVIFLFRKQLSFKKMKPGFLFFLFLIIPLKVLFPQSPQIKWWYDTEDMSFGNAAMADVDGDNLPEIAFSTYRNDERLIVLNAEDGSLLWDANTGGCNDVAPIIYDVDMDGELEIVLASSCVAQTFCFDALTGMLEWSTPTHGSDSPPTIADVDNDNKPEILHGEFNGWIICINGEDGSIEWEFNADPNCWIQTAPTILDVDGNGQLDFVVANWSFGTNNKIWAFRGDNHALIWESDLPNDVIYHGASHADIDGDGKPELAIGDYSGLLNILNAEDGSLLWDYSFPASYYIGAPTSIADLDNDEHYEIIAIGWFKVAALNHDGSLLWNYSIPGYGSTFRGAAISDVNNDEVLDVIFGTSEGNLIALNGNNGTLIWNIDLQAHFGTNDFEIDHGPLISDFDGDGLMDAFVVGGHAEYPAIENNYGRAYAVSLESEGGPDWPMFRRNIIRNACVCDSATVSFSEKIIPETGKSVNFLPIEQKLKITLIAHGTYDLKVYNSAGLLIIDKLVQHNQSVDLSKFPAGMYLYCLSGNDGKLEQGKIFKR